MAQGGNHKIITDSLFKARKYSQERNYGRSFAHYLVVFQLLSPNARKEYENEFTAVLHFWGSILHKREKYEDVFRCYHLATTYFPNSVEIINNLGIHSLKLRNFKSAKTYFENSLNIDRNFLPAEQNLQTTKYALVERWHFPMLNDLIRNKSYAQAIFMEISHGFTNILDIGTGTGILSLFASKSKQCKSIIACDYSDTMFEIASKVLQANNVRNVKLIQKSSIQISIPEDFNKKATLLITEILDCGIFGENILETLIHAWEHLLIPVPYGKVIPGAVSIYITGIQSDELSRKFRVMPRENNLLKICNICIVHASDPYDTENLNTVDITNVTETKMGLNVNFNNVLQLKMLHESEDNNQSFNLKCTKSGRIDSFAVWFTLHLNDEVSITTDPKSPNKTCWDQAVRYLNHPLHVEEGQELNVELCCCHGYLEIESPQVEISNNSHSEKSMCHMVPKNAVFFLNDILLMNCIEEIANILASHFKYVTNLSVLDMTPFPILGLLLVQRGAYLTYCVRDLAVELAIRDLCEVNSIDISRIRFVKYREFNEFTSGDVRWDVVFQSLVSVCGLLCEGEAYQASVMKMSLTNRGIYLPSFVTVWAQLVQCEWLDQATRVDDKNVCGFKIAQFLNEYKSCEQRDLNFEKIPHVGLTEPVKLGIIQEDLTLPFTSLNHTTAVTAGRANAVFYWFEITFMEGKSLSTRRPDAFAQHAAFMLNPCVSVTVGALVPLVLKQHKGLMKIYVNGTQ